MSAIRLIKHEVIPGCGSFEVRFARSAPGRASIAEVCGTSPLPWSETNSRKSVGVSAVHRLHESIVINAAMEYGQWTTSISDNPTC
jgi:hypothetical protein